MTRFVRTWSPRALVALLAFAGAPALAEESAIGFERTPPRLSFSDGDVSYWRPGASDWSDARVNTALAAGDALSTGAGANLELQIGSRAWLRAGEATQLGLTSLEPDFLQLKLTTGTTALDLRELGAGHTLEIDTPNAAFTIERPGFYRVEVGGDETKFTSRRGGRATVSIAGGLPSEIAANEQLVVTGSDAPVLVSSGAPALDDWDRWNYSRAEQQADPASARYVPAGVAGVDDLDRYGTWQTVPTYGAVWQPRVVVGWTPYSTGTWVADPYYGWTWVDDAPWGWAPFHYGRWVYVGGYWAWSPGPRVVRAYYAPALVGFYGGANVSIGVRFGGSPYTGWVALGWGEPIVPWWGPRGCRGNAHWAGWYGPRVVNNVIVNNTTVVNVNEIRTYEHAGRRGALVAVDRDHFGHGDVQKGRLAHFDRSRLRPVNGAEIGVRPEKTVQVSADRRREAPAREIRERRVVTRSDSLEPGMRDAPRTRTRESRGNPAPEQSAAESAPKHGRVAREQRSSPPPTRIARQADSDRRRSVSQPPETSATRDSPGDGAGDARDRVRAGESTPPVVARSREARGTRTKERVPQRESQYERRATREAPTQAAPAPPSSQREESRAKHRSQREVPQQRMENAAPQARPEFRQPREPAAQPAPRNHREEARPQHFEQHAPSENRQQPARQEFHRDATPQAAPSPSPGNPGERPDSGNGNGNGRHGGEGRRSKRG